MNILFVCTANRDRSRTAEIHFSNKYPEHRFRSAGINEYLSKRHGGVHLKQYMLDVFDQIVCMEIEHVEYIRSKIGSKYIEQNKVFCLSIGDTDTFMSEQLIRKLEEKFKL